jgi:hypothetical protein
MHWDGVISLHFGTGRVAFWLFLFLVAVSVCIPLRYTHLSLLLFLLFLNCGKVVVGNEGRG